MKVSLGSLFGNEEHEEHEEDVVLSTPTLSTKSS